MAGIPGQRPLVGFDKPVTIPPHLVRSDDNVTMETNLEWICLLILEVNDYLTSPVIQQKLKDKDDLSQRSIVKARFTGVMRTIADRVKVCKGLLSDDPQGLLMPIPPCHCQLAGEVQSALKHRYRLHLFARQFRNSVM